MYRARIIERGVDRAFRKMNGHVADTGITTVELLVGMVISAIIGAFALGFLVLSSGTAGSQVARQQQEATTLDAINRVSRDVTYAAPIIYASPTDLILRSSTSSSQQSAIRYSIQGGNLITWTIVNPATFPGTPSDAAWTPAIGHIITNRMVSSTNTFTFFDRSGSAILATSAAPLIRSTGGTARIGWVSVDVLSAPKDYKGTVEIVGKARASSEVPIGICVVGS